MATGTRNLYEGYYLVLLTHRIGFLNHPGCRNVVNIRPSCSPNMHFLILLFEGNYYFYYRAGREIKEGEELFAGYEIMHHTQRRDYITICKE